MAIKYIKSTHSDPLEGGVMGKMRLSVNGENVENIWVKRFDGFSILQNHSINLFPFESWGAIIPSVGSEFDLHDMQEKYVIELHPEAFDTYVKESIITPDGEYIVKEVVEEQTEINPN